MHPEDGRLLIDKEGWIAKFVPKVDQICYSGSRAQMQGQLITYVTERCVMPLLPVGPTFADVAPGVDLQRDLQEQATTPLHVAGVRRVMDVALFRDAPVGLAL